MEPRFTVQTWRRDGVIVERERTGFGAVLARLRKAHRLSQSKLAEGAGFDHSYASRLESGARTPTREAVIQLTTAMGASDAERDELLAAAGFMPNDPDTHFTDPALRPLAALLRSSTTPDEHKEWIRASLRMIADVVKRAA